MIRDQEETRMLCMLAEHGAILESIVERLERQENSIAVMDDRLGIRIDAVHSSLANRIDKIDDRLRTVEKSSAVYGTTAGALMSTLITVALNILLGKSH
jgi:hypothetical protein